MHTSEYRETIKCLLAIISRTNKTKLEPTADVILWRMTPGNERKPKIDGPYIFKYYQHYLWKLMLMFSKYQDEGQDTVWGGIWQ